MQILMFIFAALYLAGIIVGHMLGAISDNTYYICIGLWGIMFILNMNGEHNERW